MSSSRFVSTHQDLAEWNSCQLQQSSALDFDDVLVCVPGRKLLQLVCETAPQVGCNVYLVNPDGSHLSRDLMALCRGLVPFPGYGVHVHIRTQNALVSSSSLDDPQLVNIDCTGWVVMTWGVPKTTASVFVHTSTVSPSMALL